MQLQYIRLTIGTLLIIGCAPTRLPAPLPPRPPEPRSIPDNQQVKAQSHSWQFSFRNNPNSYSSVTQVTVSDADAGVRRDTISTRVHFSISVNREATLATITGQLNQAQSTSARKAQVSRPIIMSSGFSGSVSAGRVSLQLSPVEPEASTCDNPVVSYLSDLHAGLFSLPAEVQTGSSWVDTVSAISCNGNKLPLTIQIIRTYEAQSITREGDTPYLLINRTEQITFSGSGSQDQHRVQLEGKGTGSSSLLVDPETGTLHRTETSQHITFVLLTSGRSYHFIQEVKQRIDPAL